VGGAIRSIKIPRRCAMESENEESRNTQDTSGWWSIGCAIHRSGPLPRLAPKINVYVDSVSRCKPK